MSLRQPTLVTSQRQLNTRVQTTLSTQINLSVRSEQMFPSCPIEEKREKKTWHLTSKEHSTFLSFFLCDNPFRSIFSTLTVKEENSNNNKQGYKNEIKP